MRNHRTSVRVVSAAAVLVLAINAQAWAQDSAGTSPEAPKVSPTIYTWKKVSAQEREQACRAHEGSFISYYGDIWKVENCQRRGIRSQNAILDIVSQVNSVVEVDGRVIAVLPEGKPLVDDDMPRGDARGCKDFEGKFVTHSYLDIFLIENCKKRLLPDWETYLAMKTERRDERGEILSLNAREFHSIPLGKDITSVADAEFHRLMQSEKAPEVVPVNEACRGVEGQFVAFYSRLYKIENCRKREIDPDHFFDQRGGLTSKVVDLTPDQWMSIPDGKPMPAVAPPEATPTPTAVPFPAATVVPAATPAQSVIPVKKKTPKAERRP